MGNSHLVNMQADASFVDSVKEKLNKRIKIGYLTVQTEKKIDGLVTIRYYCKETYPGIGYGHIISPIEMLMFGTKIDNLVDHIISEIADSLEQNGRDPSDYLEV